MKIAFVTSEFVTEETGGGQASYLANMSNIMADHGHSVWVITKSNTDESFEWKKNITIVRVDCSIKNSLIAKIAGRYGVSYYINRAVNLLYKTIGFDIIQFTNLNGIPLLMRKGLPSVLRISDFSPAWDMAMLEHYDLNELKLSSKEKQRFKAFKKAKAIFGPSEVCAKMTSEIIGQTVKVIESPLCVCEDSEKPEIFGELLEGKDYYLFFGSLNFLKGLHIICDIADAFLDDFRNEYIVFLGSSGTVPYNNGYISVNEYINRKVINHRDHIIVMDPLSEKKHINYVIDNAIACIMPSRIDNLPNTCIEAMARGKIVIGTRGASFEQLIVDGVNGFLISVDNSDELMEKMELIIKMGNDSSIEMGDKAKNTVNRMSPDKIYDKMIELYNSIK